MVLGLKDLRFKVMGLGLGLRAQGKCPSLKVD